MVSRLTDHLIVLVKRTIAPYVGESETVGKRFMTNTLLLPTVMDVVWSYTDNNNNNIVMNNKKSNTKTSR